MDGRGFGRPHRHARGWQCHPAVVVEAGSGLSQPAGVPHNVVARSDDLEVLEINVPATYGTWDLAEPPAPWDRAR